MKYLTKPAMLLLIASFTFLNLTAQKDKGFNFPADIGKGESIILIGPLDNAKVTEAVIEAFEKEYKGQFEVTGDKYAKGKKYQDAKYQYMVIVMEDYQPGKWIGKERFPPTTNYKFGLMNIKTGQSYYTEFWSGAYKKGAKYYVKHLEDFRAKNGGG